MQRLLQQMLSVMLHGARNRSMKSSSWVQHFLYILYNIMRHARQNYVNLARPIAFKYYSNSVGGKGQKQEKEDDFHSAAFKGSVFFSSA